MKLIKYFLIFAITFSFLTQEKISAQTDSSSEYTVEEILVTARKRTESIQDVPVAVSALSISQIERGNIQRVQDLEKLVPNVEMSDMAFAGGAISAGIRGLTLLLMVFLLLLTLGLTLIFLILSQLRYFVDHKVHFLEEIQLVALLILIDQNQLESLELKLKLI